MKIGLHQLSAPYILAPMAGITDLPFRKLCREMGAGLAVSEMVHANPDLWESEKSQTRLYNQGEKGPISIQILGTEPEMMAIAARENERKGADIIDINMGCPAKKVCRKAAGSALMQDETLVAEILEAVVDAVECPVTLKIRTGWDEANKNGLAIATIAESMGIAALTIHGRTREAKFRGNAEYETIEAIKSKLSIPVIANGDIDSIEKADAVLKQTGADAVMIGRAALGNPWIFHSLVNGTPYIPNDNEFYEVMERHLKGLYELYGVQAVRISRKHLLWYLEERLKNRDDRIGLLAAKSLDEQLTWIDKILSGYTEVA